jgi:uncharacterized protein (DUF2384 family)
VEQTCVLEVTRRRLSVDVDATMRVQQVFGIEVNSQFLRFTLCRASLYSQSKRKKPHLSSKNMKAYMRFVRIYQYWVIYD